VCIIATILLPLTVAVAGQSVAHVDLPSIYHSPQRRIELMDATYRHAAEVAVAVTRMQRGPVTISAAPVVTLGSTAAALLGSIGLIASLLLMRIGLIPRSFDELDEPDEPTLDESADDSTDVAADSAPVPAEPSDDPHDWLAYPHPRREALKEVLFLIPPIAGLIAGAVLLGGATPQGLGRWGDPLSVLGGVLMGYLVGGGIVWVVRVLGTLAFNKEAMGLGDVHLLAAVGAVCGWRVAVVVFFIAPFLGLSYAVIAKGTASLLKRRVRIIPYGPHLAAATLVVMIFHDRVLGYFGMLLGL